MPPEITGSTRPSASLPLLMLTAFLAALFVFGIGAFATPATTLGASVDKAAVCGANLRTSARTTAHRKVSIKTGTRITVSTSVSGGKWHISCGGKSSTGKTWYRITSINGQSVKSRYGVTYLYAAAALFKPYAPAPYTRFASCNLYVRTGAATTAASKALLQTDAKVTVVQSVPGAAWSSTCANQAVSGTAWFQISAVGDQSVQSLYGVGAVYAAAGLFKTSITPAAAPPPPAPAPAPGPKVSEGIDVSHWQGPIDWAAVAASGKKFAYLKASEDVDFVDDTYNTNRAAAQAQGLYVGAYHFATPSATVGDGAAEADHFVDTALPVAGELLPVLDLEKSGGLTNDALIAWVQQYLQRIYDRLGVHAVIYCSPNFWKTHMNDTTWFADNGYAVLWVAHWTTAPGPTVPGGVWGGKDWTFWQYTSDGAVPGISGRVDLNRYNGTDFKRVLIH